MLWRVLKHKYTFHFRGCRFGLECYFCHAKEYTCKKWSEMTAWKYIQRALYRDDVCPKCAKKYKDLHKGIKSKRKSKQKSK